MDKFETKIENAKIALEKLSEPNVSLEDSLRFYKDGMESLKEAQKMLEEAQLSFEEIKSEENPK